MENEIEKLKKETTDAFKNRAILYRYFFEEFSKEFGEEKTTETMKRAIYRWGSAKTEKYGKFAEKKDFKGLAEEFVKTSVCQGELFVPAIEKIDGKSAVVDMLRCPLVEAWKDMGLSSEEVTKMCEIANATDYGKYEGMGFKLKIESSIAKGEDRCRLSIEEC